MRGFLCCFFRKNKIKFNPNREVTPLVFIKLSKNVNNFFYIIELKYKSHIFELLKRVIMLPPKTFTIKESFLELKKIQKNSIQW
ncbi:MAG TPA: hypothetical protein DCS19_11140 [Flavobacterium sp.]|nr:hypothetical protein [Flavobacterium sp.]